MPSAHGAGRAGTHPSQDPSADAHKSADPDVPGSSSIPLRRITSITQDACMSTTGETARRAAAAPTGVAP
ncbi:hypothetical protein GCM10010360_32110 [Streptomyces nogalater]